MTLDAAALEAATMAADTFLHVDGGTPEDMAARCIKAYLSALPADAAENAAIEAMARHLQADDTAYEDIDVAREQAKKLWAAVTATVPALPADAEVVEMARLLRSLSRAEHSDLSIGEDAATLLERLAARGDGWLPIDSAPKGGGAEMVTDPAWVDPPRILLRFGDEGVSIAYWDWFYAEGGSGFTDGFAWVEPFSGELLNLHFSEAPTHYRPLPPPPAPRT